MTKADAPSKPAAAKDKAATGPSESDDTSKSKAAADPTVTVVQSDCVVKEDFHVGRAVNGKVCSYHAMHYDAQGNRR